jgi:hypothetical protein
MYHGRCCRTIDIFQVTIRTSLFSRSIRFNEGNFKNVKNPPRTSDPSLLLHCIVTPGLKTDITIVIILFSFISFFSKKRCLAHFTRLIRNANFCTRCDRNNCNFMRVHNNSVSKRMRNSVQLNNLNTFMAITDDLYEL